MPDNSGFPNARPRAVVLKSLPADRSGGEWNCRSRNAGQRPWGQRANRGRPRSLVSLL
jgi:hypothetical protein